MNSTFSLLFIIFTFFPNLSVSSVEGICRGLALEGGPNKGAYQAGALAGLIAQLPKEETAYDVVSGISMGAVNAAWISQFPKGEEQPMVNELLNFWLKIKPYNIYRQWLGGEIQGLLFEPSLYDTRPGQEYLKSHITKVPNRYIAIGSANIHTGHFKVFNNFNNNFEVDYLLDTLMASVAVPGLFPYKVIDGEPYFEGSVIKSLDITSIVHQCRKLNGGDDAKIVIDVVLGSHKNFAEKNLSKLNTLKVLLRTLELTSFEQGCIGLIRAQQLFPNVKFRYVIKPSEASMLPELPLDFAHDDIVKLIELGKKDAKNAVQKGMGTSFYQAVEEAYNYDRFATHIPVGEYLMKKYVNEVNESFKDRETRKKD